MTVLYSSNNNDDETRSRRFPRAKAMGLLAALYTGEDRLHNMERQSLLVIS